MFALTLPFPWLTKFEEDEAGIVDTGFVSPTSMAGTPDELISERLRNQHLTRPGRRNPAQVVASLGAMQAQDYPAAKWAIGLRAPGCHNSSIEEAFNSGSILRTHVLRPTWHLVAADDCNRCIVDGCSEAPPRCPCPGPSGRYPSIHCPCRRADSTDPAAAARCWRRNP